MRATWCQIRPFNPALPAGNRLAEHRAGNVTILRGLHRSLTSPTQSSWEGIVAVEQHRAPPEEVADFRFDQHIVTLHLGPSHTIDWGIPGSNRQSAAIPIESFSLVSAGTRLGWCRTQPTEALLVALDPPFVAALASRSAHGQHVRFRNLVGFKDPVITHILLAMRAELQHGCPASRLCGEALAKALAIHLLRQHAVAPSRVENRASGLSSGRLRRVLDHIEDHLSEGARLGQLAALARLSEDHFAMLFRQSMGVPPHRYVLERRIARAKELLSGDQLSLAEIGYALGYTSQPHFITMFRKLTGVTPGVYRKANRCEIPFPGPAAYSGIHEDQ
jgi:AraC family transcriptional regulator